MMYVPQECENLEAEADLLGSLLLNSDLLYNIDITAEDFTNLTNRKVFAAIAALKEDDRPVDIVSLTEQDPQITSSLTALYDRAVTSANAQYHADVLREKTRNRQKVKFLAELRQNLYSDDFMEIMEEGLRKFMSAPAPGNIYTETVTNILKQARQAREGGYVGIPTGWPRLNEKILGMCPGHLVTLGGFSSAGKSTLLSQMLLDMTRYGSRVLCVSAEDSVRDKTLKFLATVSGEPVIKLVRGRVPEVQMRSYLDRIGEIPLTIRDDLFSPQKISGVVRQLCRTQGLDVVAVDYAQALWTDADNLYDQMRYIAQWARHLALTNDVCVVLLSQQTQDVGGVKLRGAQELTNIADIKLQIVRELDITKPPVREFELIVAKNRPFGITGSIPMQFTNRWTGIKERGEDDDSE